MRFALILLAVAAAAPARGERIEVTARPTVLHIRSPEIATVGRLAFRGGLQLTSPDGRFGGLSALEVSRDGARLVALSDKGYWFRARLVHGPDGGLEDLADAEIGALQGPGGTALGKWDRDAESLARMPDGSLIVAFERHHRLWRYPGGPPPLARAPTPLARPPGLASAPANGGAEAMTRLADGRLLVIAERLEAAPGVFAAWVGGEDGWARLGYARTGSFRPTGAATLPSGDVVMLERSYSLVAGPAARLQILRASDIRPGSRLAGREVGRLDESYNVDNFEGISARRGPGGETLVYILSDDNYNPLQHTLLFMFELRP